MGNMKYSEGKTWSTGNADINKIIFNFNKRDRELALFFVISAASFSAYLFNCMWQWGPNISSDS